MKTQAALKRAGPAAGSEAVDMAMTKPLMTKKMSTPADPAPQ
jgi:hypothetical protein